jgi:hypothetical protein
MNELTDEEMKAKRDELFKILYAENLWDSLSEAVTSYEKPCERLKELGFKSLDEERINSKYFWTFELGGLAFQVDGYYNSWAGSECEDFSPRLVKLVTVTRKEYLNVE